MTEPTAWLLAVIIAFLGSCFIRLMSGSANGRYNPEAMIIIIWAMPGCVAMARILYLLF